MKKESTEWHRVVLYRRLAEIAELYIRKGMLVSVVGKIKSRKWTDDKGIERTITEIIAEQVQMLSNSEKSNQATAAEKSKPKPKKEQEVMTEDEKKDIQHFDDDIETTVLSYIII